MTTWHNRLQDALTARDKTWQELFEYLHSLNKIRKPSVYAWKPDANKRSTMMDADNSALVCSWLNVSPLWMFHGKGLSGLDKCDDIADMVGKYITLSESRKTAVKEVLHSMAATQEAEESAKHLRQQAMPLSQLGK